MENIGKRIKEFRTMQGLSQEELAEKASVNIRSIQRIENNQTIPRGKTLQLIGSALGTNLQTLNEERTEKNKKTFVQQLVYLFFFVLIQMGILSIYGYMTLDVDANLNSKIGGLVISILLPYIVVIHTKHISGTKRFLKYGSGLILYIVCILSLHGWTEGLFTVVQSGLFLNILVSLAVLYLGAYPFQSKVD